jgi:Autotransporter beta-domain/Bacterial Ig domain
MNAYIKLICAMLLAGFSLLANAQDFTPVQITFSFADGAIVVRNNTVGLPVRFAYTGKVFPTSEFLLDSGVQTPIAGPGGNPVTQGFRLSTNPGVRVIQFCRDPSTNIQCNPLTDAGTNVIHYALVRPDACAPTTSTPNVIAPTTVQFSANCDVRGGNGVTVTGLSWVWEVSGPTTVPQPPNTANIELSVPAAGTYNVSVNTQFGILVQRGPPFNDNSGPTSGLSGTKGSTSVAATAAILPTVAITTPQNNATFTAPAVVNFTATVDNGNVVPGAPSRVEYRVGGIAVATATGGPPYSAAWPNVPAGTYLVTPVATFADGEGSSSYEGTAITVVVSATASPTISIATPINGAVIPANSISSFTANATWPGSTITSVEYFVNDTSQGQARVAVAPFTFPWQPTIAGAYRLTAKMTNARGESLTSAPVNISVTASTTPASALTCSISPAAVATTINKEITLTAACSRNSAAVTPATLAPGESINYQWTAVAPAPALPASNGNSVKAVFATAGSFSYQLVATITNSQLPNATVASNAAVVTVDVKQSVTSIDAIFASSNFRVQPGELVSFKIIVKNGSDPVKNIEVKASVIGGNAKRSVAKAGQLKSFADCLQNDSQPPAITTNDAGEGTIQFTAGCATGKRNVMITAAEFTKMVELNGPDQAAVNVALNGIALVNAETGVPTPVSVKITDQNKLPVESAAVRFTVNPTGAGTFPAKAAVSNSAGVATASLTLNPGFAKATIEACIEGSASGTAGKCVLIRVVSSAAAIVEPATTMTQAIVQQAVDAPRVQINNIRNRLQQLRVEEVGGNSGGGGSDKSGSGAGQNSSKFGVFALGELDLAKRQSGNGETNYKLRTKGVTVGADYRAQKNLVIGGAFGALLGNTTLTGGSQKTKGYSASVFGQWLPSDNWYLNSIVNLGTNRIDNQRTSISGESLSGRGTTTQQAFQAETGYGLSKDGARFTPFVRYEMIRAKLKPFTESGGVDALAISGQTVRSNTFGLGAIAEYAISTSNGVWIPSGRVEFLSESQKQNAAFARLVNGTPVLVPLSIDAIDKSYGTWGLNLQWLAGPGGNLISSFIGYEQTFGKTGFKNDRFTAGVKVPF